MAKVCIGLCLLLLASHASAADNTCEAESGECPDEFVALQAGVRGSRQVLHTNSTDCRDDCVSSSTTCMEGCGGMDGFIAKAMCAANCTHQVFECAQGCTGDASLATTMTAFTRMMSEEKSTDDCTDDCASNATTCAVACGEKDGFFAKARCAADCTKKTLECVSGCV